jgi:hypothetical protein
LPKYLAIITVSLLLVLILAYWLLAAVFQKQVVNEFKGYLQRYHGTEVNFDNAHLSFLRSFPRVRLQITGLVFSDQEKEVMKIGELTVLLNLRKIIGDSIEVERVVIKDAVLNLLTDEQGKSTRLFSSRDSSQTGPGTTVTMASQELLVYNFRFRAENRAKKNLTRFEVTEGRFIVGINKPVTRITGDIKGVLDSLISRGTLILSKLPVSSEKLVFAMNESTGLQSLEEGFIMAQGIKLVPTFTLSKQEDGQYIDWSVQCENDLNAFFSIINLKKGKDFKQVNPDAKATLFFRQNGLIDAIQNPYTELDFAISGAKIESRMMPYPVTDLFISGNYNNGEQHSARSASIRIDTLHARVRDSFLEGKGWVNNLKDPQIRAKLAASIDLQHIIKPSNLFSATGNITANLDINSKLYDIEKEGITGKDLASGEVRIQNLDMYLQDSLLRIQIADGRISLENKLLIINHFNGLLNDETFYFEGQLSNFDNLIMKQKIEGVINVGFSRIDLTGFKPGDISDTTSGRFMEFLLSHLSLSANVNAGQIRGQFGEIDNIDIHGKWEQKKFSIDGLNLNYKSMNVQGAGQLSFKNNRIDSVRVKADISGKKLNLEDMQDVAEEFGTGNEKGQNGFIPQLNLNAHIALDTLLAGELSFYTISGNVSNSRKTDLNFDISAKKMAYGKIMADSIAFSGISSGPLTDIKRCIFRYAGGNLSLEGVLRSNKDQTITGNAISAANGLDMKQLLGSFGNFGQSFLTGDNISGNVSWTADLYFTLDSNFLPIDDDNFWKFNFKIIDSRFSNVVPIEKALSFIRQKSKEDILVSNLEFSTFFVRKKLYFQDVSVKNSVSDMNIFGTYSPKDTTADLDLQLSLSDLLFKSLKKRMIETEEGPLDVGKDKNLSLNFTGTIAQHHVKHIIRKEFIKQRALLQSQFNEFDVELQKRMSELSGGE